MEGIVTRSTGSWYEVLASDGTVYTSRLQGKHRLAGSHETNPIAVGDQVALVLENNDASITEIKPRRNHILRKSVKRTGQSQALAANIDQVLVVASLRHPRTSLGFIDRFLVSAESFRIPQILLLNKKDLLTEAEVTEAEILKSIYENVGVKVLIGSALDAETARWINREIEHKTTLVAGHSGVGKSTLLNLLSPGIHQSISAVSDFTNKGRHTTTFAEMFRLGPDTFIIDTPGIKEWGLVDMEPREISDYFPEMREVRLHCKFGSRCLHQTEPHCAVRLAVEAGQIALSRYESYNSIVMGEDNRKWGW